MSQNERGDGAGVQPGDRTLDAEPLRETIRLSFSARLRAYFLAGLLVMAPIGITLYLGWLFVTFIDSSVQSVLPTRFNPGTYLPFSVPGLGVVIVITFLILVGATTANFLGRLVVRLSERLLARIPAVRTIYGASKQIMETVLANQSQAFREVVLIEYPRRGTWSIGFITGRTRGEIQTITSDELINIFIPTTPNPTSGYLLFAPEHDCIPLSMSVNDAIKMVISAGIVTPPDTRSEEERDRVRIPPITPGVAAELIQARPQGDR